MGIRGTEPNRPNTPVEYMTGVGSIICAYFIEAVLCFMGNKAEKHR